TGRPGWQFNTGSSIGSSPILVDGVRYFGSTEGKVWAVDAKTGNPVPTWRTGVRTLDEVATAPAVANGYVYALSGDSVLNAIGTATGKIRWSYRFQGQVINISPIVSGDSVIVEIG